MRQILAVDLENGNLGARVHAEELRGDLMAIVEIDRDHVAVEHVAPDREDMAFAANQKPALIRLQTAKTAGAEDLDNFGLGLGDDVGKRDLSQGGAWQKQC